METVTKYCRSSSKAVLPWVAAGATAVGVVARPVVGTLSKCCRLPSMATLPWVAAGATVAGVAATPVVVPAMVHMAGFGTAGIAAGSWAASFMSSYGGSVASGSICALLQSVGAAGLSTGAIGTAEAAAAGLAAVFGGKFLWGRRG